MKLTDALILTALIVLDARVRSRRSTADTTTKEEEPSPAFIITSPALTRTQVARRLGLSADTITRLYLSGRLRGFDAAPPGRSQQLLRFSDDDVERFAKETRSAVFSSEAVQLRRKAS